MTYFKTDIEKIDDKTFTLGDLYKAATDDAADPNINIREYPTAAEYFKAYCDGAYDLEIGVSDEAADLCEKVFYEKADYSELDELEGAIIIY